MVAPAQQRKRVAPYAPASAMSEFFDHIRYVKTPDKVDSGLLEDYGIAKSQAFPVLSTLKFLGIIDSDGSTTPAFRAIQTGGDEFQEALREIIQRAYAELFNRLDVSRDTRDKITNYFARNYSPATAEKATALFLDMCGEAGIPTASSPRGEKPESQRSRPIRRAEPKVIQASASLQSAARLSAAATVITGPRVVLELRLTEQDIEIMPQQDIQAVFDAAAKIEIARMMARTRMAQEPSPAVQEAVRE